jgi:hypothetical protein
MTFSRSFFELQIQFAERLSSRFGISLTDALIKYTNLPRQLRLSEPEPKREYFIGLNQASDKLEWTLEYYQALPDEASSEHATFGFWCYEIRDGIVVRQHLINTELSAGESVLGEQFQDKRMAEIAGMHRYIRANEPSALYVKGVSWLYNVDAYRRLFPPKYIQAMAQADYASYTYMSLWGQFYNRDWSIRQDSADTLLSHVEKLDSLDNLISCFPYQALNGICEIEVFRSFYGID